MTITHTGSALAPAEVWQTRETLVAQVQQGWLALAQFDQQLVDTYGAGVVRPAAEQEGHTRQYVSQRLKLVRTFPEHLLKARGFGLARAADQRARRLDLDPIEVLEDAVQGMSQIRDLG